MFNHGSLRLSCGATGITDHSQVFWFSNVHLHWVFPTRTLQENHGKTFRLVFYHNSYYKTILLHGGHHKSHWLVYGMVLGLSYRVGTLYSIHFNNEVDSTRTACKAPKVFPCWPSFCRTISQVWNFPIWQIPVFLPMTIIDIFSYSLVVSYLTISCAGLSNTRLHLCSAVQTKKSCRK